MFTQKNRENPSIPLKVTIDNVRVPFLRHSVEITHIVMTSSHTVTNISIAYACSSQKFL